MRVVLYSFISLMPLLLSFFERGGLPGFRNTRAATFDTISIYQMTCFPDSVGCDTLVSGDTVSIVITSLAGPISPEGLVAYFPFGGEFEIPKITYDMSGFENDGKKSFQIETTPDRCSKLAGAIYFNDDTITIPHHSRYNSANLTVSFWFKKANDTITGFDKFIQRQGPNSRPFSFELKNENAMNSTLSGGSPWNLQMNNSTDSTGSDTDNLHVVDLVYADTFHLVTGTIEYLPALNQTIRRLYYDAVLVDFETVAGMTQPSPADILIGNSDPLFFNGDTIKRAYTGALDELRIYNRALSPSEIEKLFFDACSFCNDKFNYKTTCDPSLVSSGPVIDSLVGDTLFQSVTSFRLPFDISHEGLLIYLPFGEGFGNASMASDMSGFGNNGEVEAGMVSFSEDRCFNETGALYFHNSKIEIPHKDLYNSPDFSFSIWFKKDNDIVQAIDKIVEKGPWTGRMLSLEVNTHEGESDTFATVAPWNLQMNNMTDLGDLENNGALSWDLRLTDSIEAETWYFVAGTIEYMEDVDYVNQALYLNGIKMDSFQLLGKTLFNNVPWKLGADESYYNNLWFSGSLDEFRYYNRVLSSAEILQLYQFKPCPGEKDTTLCFGDSIQLKNGVYFTPGVYLDTLLSEGGCDSLAIDLTILPLITGHFDTTVCVNKPLELYGYSFETETIDFPIILENMAVSGCDSTVFVTRYNLDTALILKNDLLCYEDTLFVNDNAYHLQNPVGVEVMNKANGCDSTIVVQLSFYPQAFSTLEVDLCEGDSAVLFNMTFPCGLSSMPISLNQAAFNGCDSTIYLTTHCLDTSFTYLTPEIVHTGSLDVTGHVFRFPDSTGVFSTLNQWGCDSTILVGIHWKIDQPEKIPQIITPNGDDINDYFIIPFLFNDPGSFPNNELFISDRYERLVYYAKNYKNDWMGEDNNNQPLPDGTYWYYFKTGSHVIPDRRGEINIVR